MLGFKKKKENVVEKLTPEEEKVLEKAKRVLDMKSGKDLNYEPQEPIEVPQEIKEVRTPEPTQTQVIESKPQEIQEVKEQPQEVKLPFNKEKYNSMKEEVTDFMDMNKEFHGELLVIIEYMSKYMELRNYEAD